MRRLNVFFVGASGTGKSSMADYLSERYPELIRVCTNSASNYSQSVLGKLPHDLDTDLARMEQFQLGLLDYTAKRLEEEALPSNPKGKRDTRTVIFDRSIECLAYATCKGMQSLMQSAQGPAETIRRFLSGRNETWAPAVVFLFPPFPEICDAAKSTDQGRRAKYLTPEWVYAVHGCLLGLLQAWQIPYVALPTSEPAYRMELIRSFLFS